MYATVSYTLSWLFSIFVVHQRYIIFIHHLLVLVVMIMLCIFLLTSGTDIAVLYYAGEN